MTITTLLILGIILLLLGITSFILIMTSKTKNKKTILIPIVSLCLCILTLIPALSITAVAKNHGMQSINIKITDAIDNIKYTPVQDKKLPEDQRGCIIILYKFTCNDCKAIYNELSETLKQTENVYWISSESELGKSITEDLEITEVPTGIYMRYNNYNNSVKAVKYSLATTDTSDNIILNKTVIERLLYLQEQKR